MPKEKISTDFYNYGTYSLADANILKHELEKAGVPVKAVYPGTNIGTEATANAEFPAYQLTIRACDFQRAEKVRNNLGISPVSSGEEMPYVPKSFMTWTRLMIFEIVIFLLGMAILSAFEPKLREIEITRTEGITIYSTDAYSRALSIYISVFLAIYAITMFAYAFRSLKKWLKKNQV